MATELLRLFAPAEGSASRHPPYQGSHDEASVVAALASSLHTLHLFPVYEMGACCRMGYRRFTDRNRNVWEVRARTRREWDFEPVSDNPEEPRTGPAPGYETDPYELNEEELQRLLDAAQPPPSRSRPSPFRD